MKSSRSSKRFQRVYIEIGNVCNLQCSFCPEVEREKHQLDLERFEKLVGEVRPFTDQACLHVMGEPLAHPAFSNFVLKAQELSLPLEITTNGTLLNPELEGALLQPIVRQVNFSLQSFFDNFPNANPNTYLKKIFDFCFRAIKERPDLYLNLRIWNLEPGAKADTLNFFLLSEIERAFGVIVNRRIDTRLRKSKRLRDRLYLHYDNRFRWPNPLDEILGERGTCHGIRSHVAIHADGTVVPCCLDKEANIPLGNVFTASFESIVQSDRAEMIRQGFEQGKLVEDLCKKCQYSRRFRLPHSNTNSTISR